jgi:hypothetical protein
VATAPRTAGEAVVDAAACEGDESDISELQLRSTCQMLNRQSNQYRRASLMRHFSSACAATLSGERQRGKAAAGC